MDKVWEYILDTKTRLSSKAALFVIGITIIVMLNDIFNFSSSYVINDKINQIKELNLIINDSLSDKQTKEYAIKIRQEIISNNNFYENSITYFKNIDWEKATEFQNHPIDRSEDVPLATENLKRNLILQHISSGGLFYLMSVIFIVILLFDGETDFAQRIASSIIIFTVFFFLGWLSSWLMELIPIIDRDNIWINYLINLILQILIFYSIIRSQKNKASLP